MDTTKAPRKATAKKTPRKTAQKTKITTSRPRKPRQSSGDVGRPEEPKNQAASSNRRYGVDVLRRLDDDKVMRPQDTAAIYALNETFADKLFKLEEKQKEDKKEFKDKQSREIDAHQEKRKDTLLAKLAKLREEPQAPAIAASDLGLHQNFYERTVTATQEYRTAMEENKKPIPVKKIRIKPLDKTDTDSDDDSDVAGNVAEPIADADAGSIAEPVSETDSDDDISMEEAEEQ